MPDSLCDLDADALSRMIHSRSVGCRETLESFLDRIERLNPTYNAIVSLRDRDELLREADARDAMLARGESMGWLHGMPIAIKDLASTRGIRTTWGSPIFRDFVPDADSLPVERVRRAGAIVIGKTNTPEFGLGSQTYNRVFGVTRNAYDASRCAGGSSGGAAVALALRLLPIADGSDYGGSLRNPAAFNNVLGLRPSQGRVPAAPVDDAFVAQFSTDGPMARSVVDLARMLAIQSGYDRRAPLSLAVDDALSAALTQPAERWQTAAGGAGWRGCRIGWLGDYDGYLPTEPGVLEVCAGALGALRASAARSCRPRSGSIRSGFGAPSSRCGSG